MLIPQQRLPRSKKDKKWGEDTVRAFIDRSGFSKRHKGSLYRVYDAYNGKINGKDYEYVTNPYASRETPQNRQRMPARLRNYNIIRPIIDLLLGEKSKRPFLHQVIVRNADVQTAQQQAVTQAVLKTLQQEFINQLNELGVDTGMPSEPTQPAPEVAENEKVSYRDARAIMGQQAIDYLVDYLDMPDKLQTAFLDWLLAGEVYTYKTANRDEVEWQLVSPLDIDYGLGEGESYVEDADWVVHRRRMTPPQVLDQFYDVLGEDQVSRLERPSGGGSPINIIAEVFRPQEGEPSDRDMEVMHVCWKSWERVGILTYPDALGQPQLLEVDETYKPDRQAGETIEWFWRNQWWEGYRIDGDMFVGIQPLTVQRRSMSNLSTCKGPYNGRAYSNRFSENVSVGMMGLPYQELFNIFHYRLEHTIAKNKDKITLLDINMIPKRHGWNEEKFMYFADAHGYAFIDSTAEGKNGDKPTFNQFQVLDMSLSQYIASQFELLSAVKQEWEDLVGITRQRKGQMLASDGQAATERAVYQSSATTEEIFRRFEKFEEKDLQGLLDCSRYAWRKGKQAAYKTSDYRNDFLDIDGEAYAEAEFGVFAKSASKEQEKLDTFKQLLLTFAQNGGSEASIAEILDSSNFANIKRLAQQAEDKRMQLEEAQQQAQQALQQQQLAAQDALSDKQHQQNLELEERKAANARDLKALELTARYGDTDRDNDGHADQLDPQQVAIEQRKLAQRDRELSQEDRRIAIEKAQGDRKLDIDLLKAKQPKPAAK